MNDAGTGGMTMGRLRTEDHQEVAGLAGLAAFLLNVGPTGGTVGLAIRVQKDDPVRLFGSSLTTV